jgi:endonuclease YncB( thermonuclease family)
MARPQDHHQDGTDLKFEVRGAHGGEYADDVAVCTVAGIDLADWMVRSGLGLDWPTYSERSKARRKRQFC